MTQHLFRTEGLWFMNFIQYKDMEIPTGKVSFIVGESGCGKSTLLRLFNNALSPSAGKITYNSKELTQYDSLTLRREVALVSQDSWLFEGRVRNSFEETFRIRKEPIPDEAYIQEICETCGVDFSLEKDSATLSGGERHRVYIAMFLALKPKVLMLDEPTAALDEKNTFGVIERIIGFCRIHEIDLIIVSHDRTLMETFSEHTIELVKGGQ